MAFARLNGRPVSQPPAQGFSPSGIPSPGEELLRHNFRHKTRSRAGGMGWTRIRFVVIPVSLSACA